MNVWGFSDGGNRRTVACAAYVLVDPLTGEILDEGHEIRLGQHTNSVMEYLGAALQLKSALKIGATRLTLHLDAEFVVKQVLGDYGIKDEKFRPLRDEIWSLGRQLDQVEIKWIPRTSNRLSDYLCNSFMDRVDGQNKALKNRPKALQDALIGSKPV
jgi:ribonuclease HI